MSISPTEVDAISVFSCYLWWHFEKKQRHFTIAIRTRFIYTSMSIGNKKMYWKNFQSLQDYSTSIKKFLRYHPRINENIEWGFISATQNSFWYTRKLINILESHSKSTSTCLKKKTMLFLILKFEQISIFLARQLNPKAERVLDLISN